MWQSTCAFVASAAGAFRLRGPVYQFGSDLADGFSGAISLRDAFPETSYIHCQLDPDDDGTRLPLPDGAAGTVLWIGPLGNGWQTPQAGEELMRILAPGGALLVAVPAGGTVGRRAHVWSPAPRTIQCLLGPAEVTLVGWQGPDAAPHTLYGVGLKGPAGEAVVARTNRFLDGLQRRLDELSRHVGWVRRLLGLLARCSGLGPGGPAGREYYQVQFMVHLRVDQAAAAEPLCDRPANDRTGTRLDAWE
jgi:hypothetical protein